jgi:hypothetical protein
MRTAIFSIVLMITGSALAQTGPSLMIKLFDEGKNVEAWTEVTILSDGQTSDQTPDVDVDLTIIDSDIRWRITGEEDRNITLGMSLTHLDISTSFALLPDQFTDHSFAVGFNVGQYNEWQIDAVAGFGYAGSNAYGEGDAWYGLADLIFTKELDEKSTLRFMIDYNGNRTIWPDLPLPAIAYSHESSDTFSYTLGVPFSSLKWLPSAGWTVTVDYAVPFNLGAKVDYAITEPLHVFAAYQKRLDAFVLSGDVKDRRYIFEQSRIEAGVNWKPCDHVTLEVAGGHAFDMEFERGFDVRDTNGITELDDEGYIRVAANVSF